MKKNEQGIGYMADDRLETQGPDPTRIDKLVAYEQGELSEEENVELFQALIDNGTVWMLQGHYGQMAMTLIADGLCVPAKRTA